MNVRELLRSVRDHLRGAWSPAGTVAIAIMVAIGLMALGVLHVFLKSHGIILAPTVERWILVRMGPEQLVRAKGIGVRAERAARMRQIFQDVGYDVAARSESGISVPRLYLGSVPADLKTVRPVSARKKLFIQMMLPQVLLVNELIKRSRGRLETVQTKLRTGALRRADQAWLDELYRRYRVEDEDVEELKRRVDVIPVPLALAQAAVESGWGTSRFAREGNAMFGQWTWARRGGIVPRQRDQRATHSVRSFQNIADSVSAYMRNLNTHSAYAAFRRERSRMRRDAKPLDSIVLASKLKKYSERGAVYVDDILHVIKRNRLRRFRDAALMTRTCRTADAQESAPRGMLVRVPRC